MRELRRRQLSVPRVIKSGLDHQDRAGYLDSDPSKESKTEWRVNVEDDPLLTQTLQVHTKWIAPGGSNSGHAHQNEAAFYVIDGVGYEIHDGKRYDWKKNDVVLVHADSVHRHFNSSETEPALCMVFKAKAFWMASGLLQQGKLRPLGDLPGYGDRVDWSVLWTAGATSREKVVRSEDTSFELTPDGYIRQLLTPSSDRYWCFSLEMYEQRIPASSQSARHWHMVDEVLQVLEGSGRMLCWDVEADFEDKYYARIRLEPSTSEFSAGDTIWVPPNTVHQFVADGADVHLVSARNRAVKSLGYENTHIFESAPEWAGR
jgi:quercetin dioxygenase-like cupin family protein